MLMFSCQLALLHVNPFLSEGWVSDLLWWGVGEYLWGRKFLLNLQVVDLQLHWVYEFSEAVFHAFC